MSVWRLAALAALLAGIGGLVWLLRDQAADPMRAIGPDAAYISCERVAVDDELPPRDAWREHLPTPARVGKGPSVPAALFSNDMSPHDLRELGFADGRIACAAWLAPEPARLEEMGTQAFTVGDELSRLEALGTGCGCASARSVRLLGWFPRCLGRVIKKTCEPSGRLETAMRDGADAVLGALAAQPVPRQHWRLVGQVGRTGRLAALHQSMAEHLNIGGQGFATDERHPPPGSDPLVEALLAVEDVRVVHRSGEGRSITVAREVGRLLVIDHFEHALEGPLWASRLALLDAGPLEAEALVAALALPGTRSGPRPRHPTQIYDFEMLRRIDAFKLAVQGFSELRYVYEDQVHEMQAPVVSRLRFESTGEGVLELYAPLTEAGRAFVTLGDGGSLAERAGPMQGHRKAYVFEPGAHPPNFALRGTGLEQGWFDGVRSIGALLQALATADPEAVAGTINAFRVQVPVGPLPGELSSIPGLTGMRGQLSEARHEVTGRIENDVVHVQIVPAAGP